MARSTGCAGRGSIRSRVSHRCWAAPSTATGASHRKDASAVEAAGIVAIRWCWKPVSRPQKARWRSSTSCRFAPGRPRSRAWSGSSRVSRAASRCAWIWWSGSTTAASFPGSRARPKAPGAQSPGRIRWCWSPTCRTRTTRPAPPHGSGSARASGCPSCSLTNRRTTRRHVGWTRFASSSRPSAAGWTGPLAHATTATGPRR